MSRVELFNAQRYFLLNPDTLATMRAFEEYAKTAPKASEKQPKPKTNVNSKHPKKGKKGVKTLLF